MLKEELKMEALLVTLKRLLCEFQSKTKAFYMQVNFHFLANFTK